MSEHNGQHTFEVLQQLRAVREFEVAFREATGLAFSLKPVPEDPTALLVQPDENAVCSLVCSTAGGRALCREFQQELRRGCERELRPQQLQCVGGLKVVAVPVAVGGKLVGILHTNRLLVHEPRADEMATLAKQLEGWGCPTSEHDLAKRFKPLPVVTPSQLEGIIKLLQMFAEHLSDLAVRSMLAEQYARPSRLDHALQFVHQHQFERLRLSEVAEQANLSPFHFCKLFHKTMGMTFTDYVVRQRIEKAKGLLWSNKARVADIATEAGFGSVAHFIRSFKRHTGLTPTAYRAAHLNATSEKGSVPVIGNKVNGRPLPALAADAAKR